MIVPCKIWWITYDSHSWYIWFPVEIWSWIDVDTTHTSYWACEKEHQDYWGPVPEHPANQELNDFFRECEVRSKCEDFPNIRVEYDQKVDDDVENFKSIGDDDTIE